MSVILTAPKRKPGPNELCWCSSGVKYKRCHRESDQRDERDLAKREVESPQHSHLDATCAFWDPQTNTAAITQPGFSHLLSRMGREGQTVLHILSQDHLGKDPKLFAAAIRNIEEKGVRPHFHGDPSPDALVLGQRLADRIFGRAALELRPTGSVFGRIGKNRLERSGDSLIGYWGWEGGLGMLLREAMLDEKEREGFRVPRRLLTAIALATLLEELESIQSELSAWRFPYDSAGVAVPQVTLPALLESALTDPQALLESHLEAHALAVGLWLAPELAQPLAQVLERHRLPAEVSEIISPFWERLDNSQELLGHVRAAGEHWRRPETAGAWAERLAAEHGNEVAEELVAEPAVEAAESAAAPPEPRHRLVGVFAELERVRERFQGLREEIGEELTAIAERRSALVDERQRLEEAIAKLDTEDGELIEKSHEVERRQVDFDPQESRELAGVARSILERSTRALEAIDQRWEEVVQALDARMESPQLDAHSKFLGDLRQQRESGLLAKLPESLRQMLEAKEAEARAALSDLPELPVPTNYVTVPIAFATSEDAGRVRLEVVFPRRHEYRQGSLQAELDESIVEATRMAMVELKCQMASCRVEDHHADGIGVLAVSAEGEETSVDIVRIAFDDSLGRERQLLAAGVRFEMQALDPDALDLLVEREQTVADHR